MKAIVFRKYGPPDVLQLEDVERPVPKDHEVLIKVHATTVTPMDWRFRKADPFFMRMQTGLLKPRITILGVELAGEVEAVGKDVQRFKKGDEVFGGSDYGGAHAEYACLSEEETALKPSNMTYEEAAAVPFGALTALQFLRRGDIQSGDRVLINGASGGVGTFAVQLAKYFGAEVTGVCSTANLELVRSLGADEVIDYTQEDFAQRSYTYDIILDAVAKSSFSHCKGSLQPKGIYLTTTGSLPLFLQMLWTSRIGTKKAIFMMSSYCAEDLDFLKERIEAGKLRSVIDRRYPLREIAEAHQYSEAGHARGKIIVTVAG
jgi:NADPH:quinone reductase-like Zn-dependent oxidoreductase